MIFYVFQNFAHETLKAMWSSFNTHHWSSDVYKVSNLMPEVTILNHGSSSKTTLTESNDIEVRLSKHRMCLNFFTIVLCLLVHTLEYGGPFFIFTFYDAFSDHCLVRIGASVPDVPFNHSNESSVALIVDAVVYQGWELIVPIFDSWCWHYGKFTGAPEAIVSEEAFFFFGVLFKETGLPIGNG